MDPNKVLQEQSVIAQRMHEETGAPIIKVPIPGRKGDSLADISQLLGCEPGEVRQRVEGLHFALRQIVAMTSPMGTDSGDAGVYRVARAALAGSRKAASEPQVLRRPVHAYGIEGKTVCGLAIENNHTESDPILRGPLHESVTCETCMARSRKAEEGS